MILNVKNMSKLFKNWLHINFFCLGNLNHFELYAAESNHCNYNICCYSSQVKATKIRLLPNNK